MLICYFRILCSLALIELSVSNIPPSSVGPQSVVIGGANTLVQGQVKKKEVELKTKAYVAQNRQLTINLTEET